MSLHPTFRKSLLLTLGIFLLQSAQAQSTQAEPAPHFKHEIGLDFAPFVRGQQGASLIYKHKIGAVKTKKWQKQSALRLVAGFYKDGINAYESHYQRSDTAFVLNGKPHDTNRYFVDIGFERQLDRNKFRFFYGAEVGYQSAVYESATTTQATVQGSVFPYDSTRYNATAHGPEASIFAGANYFFLPHFSIGLEVHLSYGVEFDTQKATSNRYGNRTYQSTVFVSTLDLLHLLYLGYYF